MALEKVYDYFHNYDKQTYQVVACMGNEPSEHDIKKLISGGVELAMRLAAAILLSRFLGYVGVCLANPVAWTGAAVMLVPAYLAELRRQQNNALARAH